MLLSTVYAKGVSCPSFQSEWQLSFGSPYHTYSIDTACSIFQVIAHFVNVETVKQSGIAANCRRWSYT